MSTWLFGVTSKAFCFKKKKKVPFWRQNTGCSYRGLGFNSSAHKCLTPRGFGTLSWPQQAHKIPSHIIKEDVRGS
jgi:hypothetical protein